MNKRERERIEREKLKQMLDESPKLKAIIDGLIENPNPELAETIKPVIEEQLSKAINQGIQIGYQGALLGVAEKVKKCKSIEEVVEKLTGEVNSLRAKWGLKPVEDVIAEDEDI